MQLSILIVSYNVKYFLEQCLYSVQAAINPLQAEVIVVDNNSTDGSLAYLRPFFPWVKWIANRQNTGFGVANNQALERAAGEAILFLNPDTLLPEDCLQKCLAFLKAHPQAGALGIKMLDGSGQFLPESKRGFPSPLTSLYKLTGLAVRFPRSKTFARYHLGHLSKKENSEVEVLAGAFMLVRRAVLQQTGAFDERFFMYGEDIDLSYRIRQAGWQNWYFADSSILHFKGESTKKGNLGYVRMFYQAMNLFVQKHYSGGSAWLYRRLIQAAIRARAVAAAGVSFLKKGKKSVFKPGKTKIAGNASRPGQTLVAASENDFVKIKAALLAAGTPAESIRHFLISEKENHLASQLPQVQELIFCLGKNLPTATAIRIMEQYPQLRYAFHYSGSHSLISSSSKDHSGDSMPV